MGLKEVGVVAGCSLGTGEPGTQREVGRVRERREDEEARGSRQRGQGEITPSL